jgi:hypothetical protein
MRGGKLGILFDRPGEIADEDAKLFARRACGTDIEGDALRRVAEDSVNHFGIQGLLVTDMVVDRRLVHTGPPGDLVHVSAVETDFREDLLGDCENMPARFLPLFLYRFTGHSAPAPSFRIRW